MNKSLYHVFTPKHKKEFWESIKPNLSDFIDSCEKAESWTNNYSEIPDLYNNISETIPALASFEATESETREILYKLISILTSMPFGDCIMSLVHLDKLSNGDLGWSIFIYMEALEISEKENHELNLESKNLVERIEMIVNFDRYVNLFKRGRVFDKISKKNTVNEAT
jgi:hypothetical protein